ncbi:MAG: hypothetical protein AB1696_04920 [Planctomycetota bacterium]
MKTLLRGLVVGLAMLMGTMTAEARPHRVVRPSRTLLHGRATLPRVIHATRVARAVRTHSPRRVVASTVLTPRVQTRVVTVPTYTTSGTQTVVKEIVTKEVPVEVPVVITEETTEAADEEATEESTEETATTDEATKEDEEKADEESSEESSEETDTDKSDKATDEQPENSESEDNATGGNEDAEKTPSE